MEKLELSKPDLHNDLMDRTITPQDYQDMKGRIEKDLVLLKDKLTDLQQQTSSFKIYVRKEVPMLENLLEFYRKSDGAAKKKILSAIFAENLAVENGKLTAPIITESINLIFRISKSFGNSKETKESDIDYKSH